MKEGEMNIRRGWYTLAILLVTAAFITVTTGSVLAGEEIRTRSAIMAKERVDDPTALRLRLKSQLKKETGLNEEELEALDPILAQALELNGGDTEPIRKMVRRAVQIDCVGECLMARLQDQNRQMLQEKKQAAAGEHVEAREQLRIRTRTRDGEQSGEATRSETQTQTQDRSGSGDGTGNVGASGKQP